MTQIIVSKEERAAAHKVIRDLFEGTFESSVREVAGEKGQRLAIRWGAGRIRQRNDKQGGGKGKFPLRSFYFSSDHWTSGTTTLHPLHHAEVK